MTDRKTNNKFSITKLHFCLWGYSPKNKLGDLIFKTNNKGDLIKCITLSRKKGYTKFTISRHGFNTNKEFNNMCNLFQGKKTNNDLIYINEKNKTSHGDWK
jgi:hypothetical protein